jgi:ribonucleoside-diphosphate reductase alpha chain
MQCLENYRFCKNYPNGNISKGGVMESEQKERITVETQVRTQNFIPLGNSINVTKRNTKIVPFESEKIRAAIIRAAGERLSDISVELIEKEVLKNIYDMVTTQELEQALIMAAVTYIEIDPAYDHLASQLLMQKMYREVFGRSITNELLLSMYRERFIRGIERGVETGIFDKRLLEFDLGQLALALCTERDTLLNYLGAHTLYDRYFLKIDSVKVELPQAFWMRIAMGLAINESNKTERVIEFYTMLSTLRYITSTPTLFHSGYKIAQLSSCYLTTIKDDLHHIFKCMGDNAQLAKWAGGIGNDWTNVRGIGSWIKSIRATSQGSIPFMKFASDIVNAITRSGIRRGGTCGYLETWHIDIEDFLDLRRNTGDERRRTHDMNTANWIPDLFMKRVEADGDWTLFSPDEVADLHGLYGKAFEDRYIYYEQCAREGKFHQHKVLSAKKLWRKMLSRLFETGHPWITFKDPCNLRSPQDHAGVVNSSNLCTEITLNTSDDETAVCNLGSVNFARHYVDGVLDKQMLARTITSAIRMLDNVIDLNFYPTQEAENANIRHRPIGLGCMGFQNALFEENIPFSSEAALEFADELGEFFSYYALLASSQLARERGAYQSYKGSKWDRGIFPQDTIDILEKERGMKIDVSRTSRLDWTPVREHVKQYGIRNSNVMAIAPTATISNIAGSYPSIEPIYRNLYVKANIAGEFTIVNTYLVHDLKQRGLWSREMLEQLKYCDGDVAMISLIPADLKEKYKTAFELDPLHLVKITATRGKWIDQSQSYNVFMKGVSGVLLNDIYMYGWKCGMKTFYYLRTLGATQIEKSTLDAQKFGFTQKREYSAAGETMTNEAGNEVRNEARNEAEVMGEQSMPKSCNPFDISCESCQ